MATALDLLSQRQQEDWIRIWDHEGQLRSELTAPAIAADAWRARDWLVGQDWSRWDRLEPAESSLDQPVVLLAAADPAIFLVWFSAVTSLGYPLFLADSTWGLNYWQQIASGLAPQLIITDPGWSTPDCLQQSFQPSDPNAAPHYQTQSFPQLLTSCGKRSKLAPDLSFSDFYLVESNPKPVESLWIGIPTGGSSGQLRFALHNWNSLTASVSGLQQSNITCDTEQIHSCCTLPLHHVSGLMQFLRSLLSGGRFRLLPWPTIKAYLSSPEIDLPKINLPKVSFPENSSIGNEFQTDVQDQTFTLDFSEFFISLVPTQLQRLIELPRGCEWLTRFNTVLLGGAPASPALLEQARRHGIRLAPTYGMTETASQIITLHPDDFLRGQPGCGQLLPHAQVEWLAEPGQNWDRPLEPQEPTVAGTTSSGILMIRARSLALGYYSIRATDSTGTGYSGHIERWAGPADLTDAARRFVTDDWVRRDAQGFFHVIGRASDKIISGGENVFPASVEAAILATGLVKDAVVVGVADPTWGERVVAIVVPVAAADSVADSKPVAGQLAEAIAPILSPAQRPKQWRFVQSIPRNAQGKLQRRQLRDWLASAEQ